jgi:hypothetical protein
MVTEINGLIVDPSTGGNGLAVSHALPSLEDGWPLRPSRIVSLYDLMKRCSIGVFPLLIDTCAESINKKGPIPQINKLRLLAIFGDVKKEFRTMELRSSKATTQKILNALEYETVEWEELLPLLNELNERLKDETSERQFFTFQGEEHSRFKHPTSTWEEIITRFPATLTDVEEAWKCWACSRYAAAVFHSLQIAETGVIELGAFIGVNDPLSNWNSVTKRLEIILDKNYKESSPFEQANRSFLEQIHATIEVLKTAWRNKVSHVTGRLAVMTREEFHPHVAEEILMTTRAFMRRLAEGLPPKPV